MAGREKKPALLNKKQMISQLTKEVESNLDSTDANKLTSVKTESATAAAAASSESGSPGKAVKKANPRKKLKRNLKLNFNAKTKKAKQIKLSKSIFNNPKLNFNVATVNLKNGIKKIKKKNISTPNTTTTTAVEPDDRVLPPTLEQLDVSTSEESPKRESKKRTKKLLIDSLVDDVEKKKKIEAESIVKETVEDVLNDVANELQLDLDALMRKPKTKVTRKPKLETTPKSEPKAKRGSPKKVKTAAVESSLKLKNTLDKKKIIMESFCSDITLDSAAENVINSLDLNVNKSTTTKKKAVNKKRRHSIEKISAVVDSPDAASAQPFVLFTNPRRSASPKSKRNSRNRQSIDGAIPKRLNPYTTRSDSPARILRNGKQRKLKDNQLLEGLDSEYRKRRRLGSEYSGSGYLSESDSSFSDFISSTQENHLETNAKDEFNLTKSDLLKQEILESIKHQQPADAAAAAAVTETDIQNLNIKQISTKFAAILKRSLSTETPPQINAAELAENLSTSPVQQQQQHVNNENNSFTDTNSNDVKSFDVVKSETNLDTNDDAAAAIQIKNEEEKPAVVVVKTEDEHFSEKIASAPSEKVPEKSLILDQMKQVFNDFDTNETEDTEKRATRSSKRHLMKVEEDKQDVKVPPVEEKLDSQILLEKTENQTQENALEEEDLKAETTVVEQIQNDKEENGENTIKPAPEDAIATDETDKYTSALDPEEDALTQLKNNLAISIKSLKDLKKNVGHEFLQICNDIQLPKIEETDLNRISSSIENQADDSLLPIEESPEDLAIKERVLRALGLQSLKAAEEAKLRDKPKSTSTTITPDIYTGTLKTVIKLNRQSDKKKRNPLKMTLQKSKRNLKDCDAENFKSDGVGGKSDGENSCYKVMKDSGTAFGWRHGSQSSDTAGANRKSNYSNRSNMDGSSEHASDADVPALEGEASTKALVIPEKASSFSIHPDRLCSDECAYCFGKFGLFDTPLHIAQIKTVDRQNKILESEIYLNRDSCLCDACYRHVDRRSNTSSFTTNKNYKRSSVCTSISRPNHCHVYGCEIESSHVLRRKWLMKMRKSVTRVINVDLDNPGLHSIPICSKHYAAVEHLMICALCKRRLARNHIHYLGFEWNSLNAALEKEGIPVKLTDKPVVCKLCRYFSSLLMKPSGDIKSSTAHFFKQYKRRLLHFHDIVVMNETEAEEPIAVPMKEKTEKDTLKRQRKNKVAKSTKDVDSNKSQSVMNNNSADDHHPNDKSQVPFSSENNNGESSASTPSDNNVDNNIDDPPTNMVLECDPSEMASKSFAKLPESVREAVEISKIVKHHHHHQQQHSNKSNKCSTVVDRLGSNSSISVRQLFPGEEDLPLQGHIDFNNVKERSPEGWEKCTCTIQYDEDTKHLWQELQKPYGNQSSFLRHLILLEKYFRNGDLTLSPNASHHAVNYSVSVQNRLRAYDNIATNSLPMQPLTMLPFNQIKKSQSGIITTKDPSPGPNLNTINTANLPKNTPIPISQLNPNFLAQLSVRHKTSPGIPPGLISLQPGTSRPVAPLVRIPQKIKLPLSNWRPTLIPITSAPQAQQTSNKKQPGLNIDNKRFTGSLVQVMSGGKPYHISIQDYNKMCTIKKNLELKQQKAVESKREPEYIASSLLKPSITAARKQQKSSAAVDVKATDKPETATTKSLMILPKIPKSLTVIPQTVPRKLLKPTSPTLSITAKPSSSKS